MKAGRPRLAPTSVRKSILGKIHKVKPVLSCNESSYLQAGAEHRMCFHGRFRIRSGTAWNPDIAAFIESARVTQQAISNYCWINRLVGQFLLCFRYSPGFHILLPSCRQNPSSCILAGKRIGAINPKSSHNDERHGNILPRVVGVKLLGS